MTTAEQQSYRRQFDQAKARMPKRHVITRCEWRNGQLTVEHSKPERQVPEFVDRRTRNLLI